MPGLIVDKVGGGKNGEAVITLDTIQELKNFANPTLNLAIDVLGYYAPGDGGGGSFYFDPDRIVEDNGGSIILGWVKIFEGVVNVKCFGALGDGVTDDSNTIQLALNQSGKILFPSGIYNVSKSLIVKSNTTVFSIGDVIIKEVGNSDDFDTSVFQNENATLAAGNENIQFHNLVIHGKNSIPIPSENVGVNNKGVGGIYLGFCENSSIRDCYFKDGWSGFVITGNRTGIKHSRNEISNCKVLNAASWIQFGNIGVPRGFNLGSIGSSLDHCYSELSATSFFISGDKITVRDCEAKNWTYDNGFYILTRDSTISGLRSFGSDFGNGITLAYNERLNLSNCIVEGASNMGYRIHAPQRETNINNVVARNCGYGIRTENTITFNPVSAMQLTDTMTVSLSVDVLANTLFEVGAYIFLSGINETGFNGLHRIESILGNDIVCRNTIAADGSATGMLLIEYVVSDISISNAVVLDSAIDAIELSKSVNIKVDNIQISGTGSGTGLDIFDSKGIIGSNLTIQKTFDQAIAFTKVENSYISTVTLDDVKLKPDTSSSRGVVRLLSSKGNTIKDISYSTRSSWGVYDGDGLNTNNTISGIKRTNGINLNLLKTGNYLEFSGEGLPNNLFYGSPGSVYHRTDGGVGESIYFKETGDATTTGWKAFDFSELALDNNVIHKTGEETKAGKLTINNDFDVTGLAHFPTTYFLKTRFLRVINPKGGNGGFNTPTITGALKIKLPAYLDTASMLTIKLNIYDHSSSDKQIDAIITGYLFTDGTWSRTSAKIIAGGEVMDLKIRFGNDGVSACIWVGEIDKVWSYPRVSIDDISIGYIGASEIWAENYALSFATTFDTVQVIEENNFPFGDESKIKNIYKNVPTPTALSNAIPKSYADALAWNLKSNNVQRKTIKAGDNVNFIAGDNIEITYSADGGINIKALAAPTGGTITKIADFTLTPAENGKTIICRNSAADIIATIPAGLGNDFACTLISEDSGTRYVQILSLETVPGTPDITLKAPHGAKLLTDYPCSLVKRTAEEVFNLQGELTP